MMRVEEVVQQPKSSSKSIVERLNEMDEHIAHIQKDIKELTAVICQKKAVTA